MEHITGKDGTDMAPIPAGEFQMGSDDGRDDEKPVHTVYLDAFYMDIYQVTNAQYRAFIEDTGYRNGTPGYWDIPKFNAADHPVVGVRWNDVVDYAKWAGKRLPTEAEWEKAARGGLVGMQYPWGDEITEENANYDTGGMTPVGNYPPNEYGLYDMAGNVWEWCADWYDGDYYSNSPERNPTGPDSGTYRVLRGGSWSNAPFNLRVAHRGSFIHPARTGILVGFRCVSQE